MTVRRPWLLAALALALAGLVAAMATVVATGGDGMPPDSSSSATAVPPGVPIPTGDTYGALRLARADLAGRLFSTAPADILKVQFRGARDAGWDGCYGVYRPQQACAELFAGGLIAFFDAGGKTYRYHIAGGQLIATGFLTGTFTLSDGTAVEPALRADLPALLAEYARDDLALRQQASRGDVTVLAIIPIEITCAKPVLSCPAGQVTAYPAAYVLLELAGKQYDYGVAATGVESYDPQRVIFFDELPSDPQVIQRAMRADLAQRLSVPTERVSMLSFRNVTWPDGCLGVHRPGTFCAQALAEGFLALVAGPDGKTYRYHGAGDTFIAASFEPTATISDPIPGSRGPLRPLP